MTVILLVAVMSGFTYWKIGQLNSYSQETARQNLTKIELAEELALDVANETLSLHRFNSSGNLADVADFFNFRKYGDDKLTKLENALSSGTARGILDSVKKEKTDFDTLAEKFITARRADELEQAGAYMKEAYKPAESVVAKTKDLTLAVKESVRDEEENSTKNARQVQVLLVAVSLLVAVLSVAVSVMISRGIARSARRIAQGAAEIAQGNLAAADITADSADEISQVSHSFNHMKANLKNLIQKVTVSAEQVAAAAEQLTASSEQSARTADQVAGTSAAVARDAKTQLTTTNETSEAIQQMVDSVQHIAASADSIAAKARRATEMAAAGRAAVEKAVAQMSHIETTVNVSAFVVNKL